MKITFETEEERACLGHILADWIDFCIEDPFGCQCICKYDYPRNCSACIKKVLSEQLDANVLRFSSFRGEKYLQCTNIEGNKDSYYRYMDRSLNFVNVRELHDKLRGIPDSYPGFIVGIIRYASTAESSKEKVLEYLKANPDANADDVTKFVKSQEDYYEAVENMRKG